MLTNLLDVIDENNSVVDQRSYDVVHSLGLRHRISAMLITKNGKFLIPTASIIKVEAGKLFHSSAGHVHHGESYERAAIRELREETGLKVKIQDLVSLGNYWLINEYPSRKEHERFEVYIINLLPSMGTVTFNEEQYNEQWICKEDLIRIYKENPDTMSLPLMLTCKNILLKNSIYA